MCNLGLPKVNQSSRCDPETAVADIPTDYPLFPPPLVAWQELVQVELVQKLIQEK